jgi:exodeoxyribonuclease III
MTHFIAWNVDGYSRTIHVWLKNFLKNYNPDLLFLGETKKPREVLESYFQEFTNYNYLINSHQPHRYHGVAMLIRKDHYYKEIPIAMNIPPRKDTKNIEASTGRIIVIQLNNKMNIIGSYTPNSGRNDPPKLKYRTTIWDPAFSYILDVLYQNLPTIWLGDINVALTEKDVSDPNQMQSWAGFTLEERTNFQAIFTTGHWNDPWREQHPKLQQYSWVGYGQRNPNYGMRIDNVIISKSLLSKVEDSYILTECRTETDHLPVGLVLDE